MASGEIMQVNIVAADHPVWSGKAQAVMVPALEGSMGILPNHEPVLSLLEQGTVTLTDDQSQSHSFEVSDGFISFDSNKLTIAVEHGQVKDSAKQ
ncbi:ATP synthase F1 subunit epsilon [Bifidobacterium aemilianum]|uniref:ATP synthase F1 subunit epsilon n=1 Tax=Bifidobacterium aemilianum TaxID=2493120 RepID=A0A366K8L9_9BIFI|nr:F0F1 ATP synthase subunit epsilon [Bifidobacterium aemilianum]RBP97667.1 ATP synthase F1 subunit epsilon [Bifidobacterium aemilianum]